MEIKPVMVAIAAFVVVIVLAAVLVPVINDATETERTYTNDGLWRMKEFETGDAWARSAGGDWTLDSEVQVNTDNANSSVIFGDDWTVRGSGAVYGHTLYANTATTPTVTINESTITVNYGSDKTISNTNGYGVATDGDYIVSKYDAPVYMNGDSLIYATGYTNVASYGVVIHIEGNIDDGVTITCSTINNTSALSNFASTNVVIHATEVAGYDDLYKLEGITFTLDFDYTAGGTTTHKQGDVSYSSYVVPYQVTAQKSVQLTSNESAILLVIPALLIIAILVGVLALVFRGRE